MATKNENGKKVFTLTDAQLKAVTGKLSEKGYWIPTVSEAHYNRETKEYDSQAELPFRAKYYKFKSNGQEVEEIRVRVSNKGSVNFRANAEGTLEPEAFDEKKIKKINRKFETDSAEFKLTTSMADYEATIEFLNKHWGFSTMKFSTLKEKCKD